MFVEDGGQASQLGIIVGDIVISYNGEVVNSKEVLLSLMELVKSHPQDIVPILVQRGGSFLSFDASSKSLGVKLEEVLEEAQEEKITFKANNNKMTIVDIQMPFWSMVVFMVKAAIAFIPAFFILSVIGTLIFTFMFAAIQ